MLRGGNLRAITRKIIEVEPYPWLEKIVKSSKKLAPELAKGQNAILQGRNSQRQALYSVWSDVVGLALTEFLEETTN